MKSNLKGDLINAAYSRARISGLTVQPSPEDMELALDRLEDMLAEWQESNICVGYNFEEYPNPGTPHGVPRAFQRAVKSNLAVTILTDFNKVPHPALMLEAQAALSSLVGNVALIQQIPYPARMPRGSGSTLRWNRWRKFYDGDLGAPLECETQHLIVGETQDFYEDFTAFLRQDETLSSYSLKADSGLTVNSQSLSSPRVNYRITAQSLGTSNFLRVTITGTTSLGRIETRVINFELTELD